MQALFKIRNRRHKLWCFLTQMGLIKAVMYLQMKSSSECPVFGCECVVTPSAKPVTLWAKLTALQP